MSICFQDARRDMNACNDPDSNVTSAREEKFTFPVLESCNNLSILNSPPENPNEENHQINFDKSGYYDFLGFSQSPPKYLPEEILTPSPSETTKANPKSNFISKYLPQEILSSTPNETKIINPNSNFIPKSEEVKQTEILDAFVPLGQFVKPTDVLNITVNQKSTGSTDLLLGTSFDLLKDVENSIEKELDIHIGDLNVADIDLNESFDLTSYINGDWEANEPFIEDFNLPKKSKKKHKKKGKKSKKHKKRERQDEIQICKPSKIVKPVKPIETTPIIPKVNSKTIDVPIVNSTPIDILKANSKPIDIPKSKETLKPTKIENDSDDDICVDVETISPTDFQPILQASNVTSLLEQFEANEVVNQVVNKKNLPDPPKLSKIEIPGKKKVKNFKIKTKIQDVGLKMAPRIVIGPVSNSKPISYDEGKKIIRKRYPSTKSVSVLTC